jgi:hypothetical protein
MPVALERFPVRRKVTKTGKPLSAEIIEVAESDYKRYMVDITLTEVEQQRKLKNEPTSLRVDGSTNTPLIKVRRTVNVFFLDTALMLRGLNEAWGIFLNRGRKVTARTLTKTEVWISDDGGKTSRKLSNNPYTVKPSQLTLSSVLYIVGPLVPYTRKYRYYGQGTRKSVDKVRNAGKKGKARNTVNESLHEYTARVVKRNKALKALNFYEYWIKVPNVNPTGKTRITKAPAVVIRTAKRTRNRVGRGFKRAR